MAAVLNGMGDGIDAQSENAEQDTLGRGGRALLVGVFEGLGDVADGVGLAVGLGLTKGIDVEM